MRPELAPFTLRGGSRAKAPERSDSVRYQNEPVCDYWQALWRVYRHLEDTREYYLSGPLPWCVTFVADMFWVSPETVRRDLLQIRRAL